MKESLIDKLAQATPRALKHHPVSVEAKLAAIDRKENRLLKPAK